MATHLENDLPSALTAASPGETLIGDPEVVHVLEEPITITTPRVTLRDISVKLGAGVNEDVIRIGADGVSLQHVSIDGNRTNQQGDRPGSGILVTNARNVYLEAIAIDSVTRHGIRVYGGGPKERDEGVKSKAIGWTDPGAVSGITIRDAMVKHPKRDGCSIEGTEASNILVDGVRTIDSSDKGCVEVKDGATDALVRGCFARGCEYVVTVQDHGRWPTTNVVAMGNQARDCAKLVTTQGERRHESVAFLGNTGRGLSNASVWQTGPGAIYGGLTDGIHIANNLVDGVEGPGIVFEDATEGSVSDNVIRNASGDGIVLTGEKTDRYLVSDNLVLDSGIRNDAGGDGLVTDNLA